jgi:uncharacterized Zn finger protein (UPF0148 family)
MSVIFSSAERRKELRALLAFSFVMVAFFITWIPPFCNRLLESVTAQDSHLFWLNITQAITNPLQGFMNMILYGYRFIPQYKQIFCPNCCNRRVKIEEEEDIMEEAQISMVTEKSYGSAAKKTRDSFKVADDRSSDNLTPIKSITSETDTPDTIDHVSDHQVSVVVQSDRGGRVHHMYQQMKHDSDSEPDIDDGGSLPYSVMYQTKDGSLSSGKSLSRHMHRWDRSGADSDRQSVDGGAYSTDGSVRIMYHDRRPAVGSGSAKFHKMYGIPSRYGTSGSVPMHDNSFRSKASYDSDDSQ